MAKFALEAGVELDLLTPKEFDGGIGQLVGEMGKLWAPPLLRRPKEKLIVDASGNVGGGEGGAGQRVYHVPAGMRAQVNRWTLDAPAYTPASPLTNGWIRIAVNETSEGGTQMFFPPAGSTVAPAIVTQGSGDGVWLGPEEALYAWGASLPASANLLLNLQIMLYPNAQRLPGEPER